MSEISVIINNEIIEVVEVDDEISISFPTGGIIPTNALLDGAFADVTIPVSGDNGKAFVWNHATQKAVWTTMSGGVTDHGALTGLGDDDHAQYQLSAGLGTAAFLNVGTGANQIVQLTAASKLPAVDGSLLTNLPGGGGGSPGGSTTQVQYNNAGAFGGYADFTFVDTVIHASDTFNRADNASSLGSPETGSAWSALAGTWGISSNQAYTSASSAAASAVIDTGQSDGVLTATFSVAGDISVIWRATDANNYWFYNKLGTLYRSVAGVRTSMMSGPSFADGDTITVVCLGNMFEIQKNGSVILRYFDTLLFNLTATKHGVGSNSNTAGRFDNFSFQNYRKLVADKRISVNKNLSIGGNLLVTGQIEAKDLIYSPVIKTVNFLPTGYVALTTPEKIYLNTSSGAADTNWSLGYQNSAGGSIITNGGVVQTVYGGGAGYGYVIKNAAGTSLFEVQGSDGKTRISGACVLADGGIRPASDSTTALQIQNAAGTVFVTGDTTNGALGIGNTPTAYLDVKASATTRASLRIRSGTAPTTPNAGDIWYPTSGRLNLYRAETETIASGVQATGGAATATAVYTATEQLMLQKIYDAGRAFGLMN